MPDSQKQKNEKKLRSFGALRCPYARLANTLKQGEAKMIHGPVPVSWKQDEEEAVH